MRGQRKDAPTATQVRQIAVGGASATCVVIVGLRVLASIVLFLVVVLRAGAARAHNLDTVGTPDPYWQNLANASGNGQIVVHGAGAVAGPAHPWLLRGYLYGAGILFVAFAGSLLRSLWSSSER